MHSTPHIDAIHEEISFQGQKENEKLIVFTRRHWFVMIKPIAFSIFASIIPIFFIILFAGFITKYPSGSVLFLLLWIMYIMSIWYVIIYKLTMHMLDTWIVTSERVLDIVQIGFFNRKVSELNLESIQDISVNTKGIMQSYLNFGNIEVQTGATAQRFLFDQVPYPIEIKDKIMDVTNAKELAGK